MGWADKNIARKKVVLTGCYSFIGCEVFHKFCCSDDFIYDFFLVDKETYAATSMKKFFMRQKEKQKRNLLGEAYRNDPAENRDSSWGSWQYVNADMGQLTCLPDCDLVINVAAESHVSNSIFDSKLFYQTNVDGVRNLLDLIRQKPEHSRPLFVHFSTDEVYGDCETGAFKETDPLNPSNPYAASKAAADLLIQSYARTYGIKYIIFRPTNNFGIGQYREKLIPLFIEHLKRGKKFPLHNQGNPVRTWCHKSDTAEAVKQTVELVFKNPGDVGRYNQIYNISSNFELTNYEITKRILTMCRPDLVFGTVPIVDKVYDMSYSRPGQDVRYALDISKIKDHAGWEPKTAENFDEFLKATVEYYWKETQEW